jgi:WhiB family redox-sensing transcriptional regulator
VIQFEVIEWHKDAACADYPNEWFFGESAAKTVRALQICRGCLVRAECLDYAVNNRDALRNGIWGGTTADERLQLKRAARRAA